MFAMKGASCAFERPLAIPEKILKRTVFGIAAVTIAITNAIEITAPVFCSITRAPAGIPRRSTGPVPRRGAAPPPGGGGVGGFGDAPPPPPGARSHSAPIQYEESGWSTVIPA